jgi:hypothetical protein
MDDQSRHGLEARADWASYHSAVEGPDARYHNRPDCPEGSKIPQNEIREGSAYRALCDLCRSAQKPK